MPKFTPVSVQYPLSMFDDIRSSISDPIHVGDKAPDTANLIILVEKEPRSEGTDPVAHVVTDCAYGRTLCGGVAGRGKAADYFVIPASVLPGYEPASSSPAPAAPTEKKAEKKGEKK